MDSDITIHWPRRMVQWLMTPEDAEALADQLDTEEGRKMGWDDAIQTLRGFANQIIEDGDDTDD